MKKSFLSFAVLLVFAVTGRSQFLFEPFLPNSLGSIIDAEQVAMGESFVANTSGLTAFKQNPATLTGHMYPTVYYSYRDNEIHPFLDESSFSEYGIIIPSPLGVTNFNYARLDWSESVFTDENGIRLGKARIYDYNLSVSHGYRIDNSLSLGVSLRMVNTGWEMTDGDPVSSPFDSDPAIVGDIGLTYQFEGFFNSPNLNDSLMLGASLQNFGTDLKYQNSFGVGVEEKTGYQLPRFFKIGFAYGFTARSDQNLPVFEYLLTAQYGRWLNPGDYYSADADLGGVGMKVRFWEVLELNLGGYYLAALSLLGDEDVLNIRYGVALNLPFERLGWNAPVTAKISYTHLPVNQLGYYASESEKYVPVITAQLSYNMDFFSSE